MDGSVDWGDYDGDADLDLLVTGRQDESGTARLYQNNGRGKLTDTIAGLPGVVYSAAAWGDYDGDADLDLVVSGESNDSGSITRIYRNDGDAFVNIQAGLTGVAYSSVDWGDYDRDGDLDLVVAGRARRDQYTYRPHATLYRNDGNHTFVDAGVPLAGVLWGAARWGDYDGDGYIDLLLAGCPDEHCTQTATHLYHNAGNGTFAEVETALPKISRGAAEWGDYDRDGDLDIVFMGSTSYFSGRFVRIYRNAGDGVFHDIFAGLAGGGQTALDWGDYDRDGDLDLVVAGHPGGNNQDYQQMTKVYRNDGGNDFVDIHAALPSVFNSAMAWGDYDNDGALDLILTGCTAPDCKGSTKIYRNIMSFRVYNPLLHSAAGGDIP
jgi:hypothetical protein